MKITFYYRLTLLSLTVESALFFFSHVENRRDGEGHTHSLSHTHTLTIPCNIYFYRDDTNIEDRVNLMCDEVLPPSDDDWEYIFAMSHRPLSSSLEKSGGRLPEHVQLEKENMTTSGGRHDDNYLQKLHHYR